MAQHAAGSIRNFAAMNTLYACLLLFGTAFTAATLLPAQSEGFLFWLVYTQKYNAWILLAAATAGNVLGSLVNWGIGHYLAHFQHKKWFPVSPREFAKATQFFQKYGVWSLLLSWVPFIGDPITLAAGTLGIRLSTFLIWVTIAKLSRYLAVCAAAGLF